MTKNNKEFEDYINDFIIDAKKRVEERIKKQRKEIQEDAAAKGQFGGIIAGRLLKAHEKALEIFSALFYKSIERDVKENPNIYIDRDFNSIYLKAINTIDSLYRDFKRFFEKFTHVYSALDPSFIGKLGLYADDCKDEIRRKIRQISRRLSLSTPKDLSIKDKQILEKVREVVNDWELILEKDKQILIKQINDFINGNFTYQELVSIYRSSIPSFENVLRNIAREFGIAREIDDLGDAINAFKKYGYLDSDTISLLEFIHRPTRDIVEHGKKMTESSLKCLCCSLFETIHLVRESIKRKKGK